jgi:Resolvase, N terminal domain
MIEPPRCGRGPDQVQVPLRRAHTLNVEVAKEFRSTKNCFHAFGRQVRTVGARGAVLKASNRSTSTAAGKCFLDMLGVFAEFETNLRRERQLEGIAKAKAAGVYKGRPPSIEASRVRELKVYGLLRKASSERPLKRSRRPASS